MNTNDRVCEYCGKTYPAAQNRRDKYCPDCRAFVTEQKVLERNAKRRAEYKEDCAWRESSKKKQRAQELKEERMKRGERKCLTEDAVEAKKHGLSYGQYMARKHEI